MDVNAIMDEKETMKKDAEEATAQEDHEGQGEPAVESKSESESDYSLSPASSKESLKEKDNSYTGEQEMEKDFKSTSKSSPILFSPPSSSLTEHESPADKVTSVADDRPTPAWSAGVGRGERDQCQEGLLDLDRDRGRGRGRAPASGEKIHLRRPGRGETHIVAGEIDVIMDGLNELSMREEDDAMDKAKVIAIKVKETCSTAKDLTTTIHALHERSLASASFATKTALLFGCLSQMEVDGLKCRSIFLNKLQQDFACAETDLVKRRNLIVLLCQIFRRVRVADGTTIKALTGPIMAGLSALVKEDLCCDEDVVVMSEQLQIIGPELSLAQAEGMKHLAVGIRRLIAAASMRKLSSTSITHLLLLLELSSSHGWRLPPDVEAFYADALPTESRVLPMEVSRQPSLPPPPAQPFPSGHLPENMRHSTAPPPQYSGNPPVAPRLPRVIDVSKPPPSLVRPEPRSVPFQRPKQQNNFQEMPAVAPPASCGSGWGSPRTGSTVANWGEASSSSGWGEARPDESRTPGAYQTSSSRDHGNSSNQDFNIGTWE